MSPKPKSSLTIKEKANMEEPQINPLKIEPPANYFQNLRPTLPVNKNLIDSSILSIFDEKIHTKFGEINGQTKKFTFNPLTNAVHSTNKNQLSSASASKPLPGTQIKMLDQSSVLGNMSKKQNENVSMLSQSAASLYFAR